MKDFASFINEEISNVDETDIYAKGVDIALSSTIFGENAKTLKFPLILATTGAGDEDGFFDDAWKISSLKELRRWLIEGHMKSKMFPGIHGGYDTAEEIADELAEYVWRDDFSNAIRVDMYPDEEAMIDAEESSEEKWGSADDYDEEGKDKDHRLIDGDLVPTHSLHDNW